MGLGSSPRARGTGESGVSDVGCTRFIPAGAGNRALRPAAGPLWSVHPRGRGEQGFTGHQNKDWRGSSPRARGTDNQAKRTSLKMRFIPAGAGNSSWCCWWCCWPPVHPRGRGEQAGQALAHCREHRFIPAGAGNSVQRPMPILSPAVHPRGRGEQPASQLPKWPMRGSSPRARGTAAAPRYPWKVHRFIPAGAGNRHGADVGSSGSSGSSPRARGTDHGGCLLRSQHRFIPAGAGNSLRHSGDVQRVPVHPRGRGEQSRSVSLLIAFSGSSPRARGTGALFWQSPA